MPINDKLVNKIKQLFDIDQDIRKQVFTNKKLMVPLSKFMNDNVKGIKTKYNFSLANFLIYNIDAIHNIKIRRIIDINGYPTTKLLGKRGMRYFWLLIQHQDEDLKLQENCLNNCDFSVENRAYLIDRIAINKGEKQIYGTQFFRDHKTKELKSREIFDKKNVNKLRKKVGIKTTVEEELIKLNKFILKTE